LLLNDPNRRQVLGCASLSAFAARQSAATARRRLALSHSAEVKKRQRAGALQDATTLAQAICEIGIANDVP